jgi:hypothetical protein
MPRRTARIEPPRHTGGGLVARLADELTNQRDSGQPIIYERPFGSDLLQATVVWDEWDRLTLEDRTDIILRAYEKAEGPQARDRIALASGLTVPEAYASGMLPYQIIAAVRKSDPVTRQECRQAMIDEGASTLIEPDQPQLRFASEQEAEAAMKRLSDRLPGSEPVWTITKEIGRAEDWYSEH